MIQTGMYKQVRMKSVQILEMQVLVVGIKIVWVWHQQSYHKFLNINKMDENLRHMSLFCLNHTDEYQEYGS